jgi:hypothetical protein
MFPEDDPKVREAKDERAARNGLIRSAVLWSPFFLVSLGALIFFLFDELTGGDRGTIFLLVVLSIFTILFGSQAIQAWLDLSGKHSEREGEITRKWTRRDSIVMQTHYIRLDGKEILRGDRGLFAALKAGDRVHIRYFRYSGVAFYAQKLAKAEPPDAPPPPDDGLEAKLKRDPAVAEPPRERKRAVRPEF